jgi:hypothetical protein
MYEREKRRTPESSVRPARAAKRERPEQTFNSGRGAAVGGKTDFDHRPAIGAIDAIGAIGPRVEIYCAYGREEDLEVEYRARPTRVVQPPTPVKTVQAGRNRTRGRSPRSHPKAILRFPVIGALGKYGTPQVGLLGVVAALSGQNRQVSSGPVAVNALVDAGERLGALERQDSPPAPLRSVAIAHVAPDHRLAESQLGGVWVDWESGAGSLLVIWAVDLRATLPWRGSSARARFPWATRRAIRGFETQIL